jgi:hypothetical protein
MQLAVAFSQKAFVLEIRLTSRSSLRVPEVEMVIHGSS